MRADPVTLASPAGAPSREVLVSLQYLRALASLMVVYFHASVQCGSLLLWQVQPVLVGASGVDIFFVLSGYVMYMSTHGRAVTVADFVKRRFVRIVPLYWLMTLSAAFVAFVAPALLRSTRFDPAHVLASLAFLPWQNPAAAGPTDPSLISPLIVPGWTLNFEMMFYVLFALSLVVRGDRPRLLALTALVGGVFLFSWLVGDATTATRFYASSIIFEFVAGTWLARLLTTTVRGPRSPLGPLIALIAALVAMLALEHGGGEVSRLLRLGIPAVVIVASAVLIERTGRLGFNRLGDELGNASYSIYLSHIFTIAGLRMAMGLIGIELTATGVPLFIAAAVVASALVGLAVHFWVEKPITRAANTLVRGRRQRNDLPVSVA